MPFDCRANFFEYHRDSLPEQSFFKLAGSDVILARTTPITQRIRMTIPTWQFILLCAAVALPDQAALAQAIQKCTQKDGSIVYQQDVCPSGSDAKTMSLDHSVSSSLTLVGNGNHQYSTTLTINGVTVPGYVDTGATFVTISMDTANRMHISTDDAQMRRLQTANGVIGTVNKTVSILKVGKFELYNVEVAIAANSPTLIGMSALSQLKFANENGNLVLSKR